MKKLIASCCCILTLQSLSQISIGNANDELNGQKVLMKAIAAIVNTDANRKIPPKLIHVPNIESPHI